MATEARIAASKAGWEFATNDGSRGPSALMTDVVAAIDQTLADGVDVISYSAGFDTGPELHADAVQIAVYNAVKIGVFVSAAAGNEGPAPGSIENAATWVTTVAATTQDRELQQNVVRGNGEILIERLGYLDRRGLSRVTNAPLVYAGDSAINGLLAENASFW